MRTAQIDSKDLDNNTVLDYRYGYDAMNNIVARQSEHGDYGYQYDELYRLTDASTPRPDNETFTYDDVGNRLTAAGIDNATYSANNELELYGDTTFEYDAAGNMVRKVTGSAETIYVYNVENRLARVENGAGSVIAEYGYDPFGRRIRKEAAGVTTYYLYSDEGLIGEYQSDGTALKTYGYKPHSTWTTDPLFMATDGKYYFYHNDHLGTPQKLTSEAGEVVWAATYTTFGKATVTVSQVENNLRFPGQYYDSESGLHYNYHRYYDVETGRYLRVDPIGMRGGINVYVYAEDSPINFIDYNGLTVTCVFSQMAGTFRCTDDDCDDQEVFVCKAYSGCHEGYNNPDMEDVSDVGPIPAGLWGMSSRDFSKKIISLEKISVNTKRFGFLIHGGDGYGMASEGCIVIKEKYREMIFDHGFGILYVVH